MTLYDTFIYYYLIGKQYYVNAINKIKINTIGINEIKMLVGDKNYNILGRYVIFCMLNNVTNLFEFMKKKSIGFRNLFDIEADKIQITKITDVGEKTIIIDKTKLGENDNNKIKLSNIYDNLNIINPDDTMLGNVIINFDLVNNYETICLKKHLIKYKDPGEIYHNTIRNILEFNDITYNENSYFRIKLFVNKKICTYELKSIDVIDRHINYFIEIHKNI